MCWNLEKMSEKLNSTKKSSDGKKEMRLISENLAQFLLIVNHNDT